MRKYIKIDFDFSTLEAKILDQSHIGYNFSRNRNTGEPSNEFKASNGISLISMTRPATIIYDRIYVRGIDNNNNYDNLLFRSSEHLKIFLEAVKEYNTYFYYKESNFNFKIEIDRILEI